MNLGLQMLFGGVKRQNDALVLIPNRVNEDAEIDTVIGLLQSNGNSPALRLNPNSILEDAEINDSIGVLQ
jgi:hypothetical protein